MSWPAHSVLHQLRPHTSSRGLAEEANAAISVDVTTDGSRLKLAYRLTANLQVLRIPAANPAPTRSDGLWRHTCFEAFIRDGVTGEYGEYNFSPSGDWAAYRFTGYREEMAALTDGAAPALTSRSQGDDLHLDVVVDLAGLRSGRAGRWRLGIAAVLEHASGALSYWAIAHPGEKPDFHHVGGFVIELG